MTILIKDLNKTYSNGTVAVDNLNLKVAKGDFYALLGQNGAGKSTTIGLITSLITKTSGSIKICGYDLDKETNLAKSCLGLVPQEINLNIFETCKQILVSQAGYYGIPRNIAIKRATSLLDHLELSSKKDTRAKDLSGGMKRRLMIARSLMHNPKVLILDEPSAGVDVEIRQVVWQFLQDLNREGTTIILTTHYLEEAKQLCNNIAIIKAGKIIIDTSMQALLSSSTNQFFICTAKEPLQILPQILDFVFTSISPVKFALATPNNYNITKILAVLSHHHIEILDIENKSRSLEDLYLKIIN